MTDLCQCENDIPHIHGEFVLRDGTKVKRYYPDPEPGSRWRHYKGGVYVVVSMARTYDPTAPLDVEPRAWSRRWAEAPKVVLYNLAEDNDSHGYYRPLSEWHDLIPLVEHPGVPDVRRFTLLAKDS